MMTRQTFKAWVETYRGLVTSGPKLATLFEELVNTANHCTFKNYAPGHVFCDRMEWNRLSDGAGWEVRVWFRPRRTPRSVERYARVDFDATMKRAGLTPDKRIA